MMCWCWSRRQGFLLWTWLQNNRGKGLPEDTVWRILIQATLGLAHIHSKKIIHRDIKALNLFLDSQNNIKVRRLT
jgi:serine/threonine protein kinase